MTKIKVVHIDEFYNFHVHEFFRWNHLVFQNVVWTCHFLKFKIWIVQTESHEKITKTNVVDLDELYNFHVHDFFIWNHLVFQNLAWSSYFLKFKFWIVQTKSHEKFSKIKVVDLDEFYNFEIYNISILDHLLY
jgi:hypothetical protein